MTASHLAPQIQRVLSRIYPLPADLFSSDETSTSTLPTTSSKALFKALSLPPDTPPLNWKRSRTRRLQLNALGVPINLEEFSTSQPLSTLVLKTQHAPSRGNSLPPPSSANSNSNAASRSSLALHRLVSPTIDRGKAAKMVSLSEDEVSTQSLAELEETRKELEDLVGKAGEVLTHKLERREKLKADSATYDLMIQVSKFCRNIVSKADCWCRTCCQTLKSLNHQNEQGV